METLIILSQPLNQGIQEPVITEKTPSREFPVLAVTRNRSFSKLNELGEPDGQAKDNENVQDGRVLDSEQYMKNELSTASSAERGSAFPAGCQENSTQPQEPDSKTDINETDSHSNDSGSRQGSGKMEHTLPKWPISPSEIKPTKKREPISRLPSTIIFEANERRAQRMREGFWRTMKLTPGELDLQEKFRENSEAFHYRVKQFPKEKKQDTEDPDRLNLSQIVSRIGNSSQHSNDKEFAEGRIKEMSKLNSRKRGTSLNAVELVLKADSRSRREEKRVSGSELGSDLSASSLRPILSPVEKAVKARSATYEAIQRSRLNRAAAYDSVPSFQKFMSKSEGADHLSGILNNKAAKMHRFPTTIDNCIQLTLEERDRLNMNRAHTTGQMTKFPNLKKDGLLCGECSAKRNIETMAEMGCSAFEMTMEDENDASKLRKKLNIIIPTQPND
ncbi:uncharacterized protein LOC106169648 [Lingula anatina]|uniref:Uncharacterized protein LOC106169648 n=1 Tax=Lingula anatina TaxID=7574 RepID=A0A1S3J467_LINAN|nr:uncharacterized protein LOC106169648 [Lingula anatina]|eukprot:XP_013404634.1 uncharacterized protein LOC106169648 [Lingula anatina]